MVQYSMPNSMSALYSVTLPTCHRMPGAIGLELIIEVYNIYSIDPKATQLRVKYAS